MPSFTTTREAKEFLIEKILAEARREGVQLSEIERKMLYYSETAWTIPDAAEMNEAFDATYEASAYEAKIAGLIRNLARNLQRTDTQSWKEWKHALRLLKREDHYILVLVGVAEGRFPAGGQKPGLYGSDLAQILLWGFAGAVVFLAILAIYLKLHQ